MENQTVVFEEKFADKVRRLEVGNHIDITKKGRAAAYNQAKLAFPKASFKTQQDENKIIYLIRVA